MVHGVTENKCMLAIESGSGSCHERVTLGKPPINSGGSWLPGW